MACLLTVLPLSPMFPGQHDRAADRGGGLRGVHRQGLGEQRPGRVPRHHGGLGEEATQAAAETQQLPQGPEEGLAAAPAPSARPD